MLLNGFRHAGLSKTFCIILAALAVVLFAGDAWATKSPFGIATPDSSGGFGGPLAPVFAWIALRQAEFYRTLTAALADIKENGWAVWLLLLVSFAYGVFHAAGPGHGKAVISAYVLSSGERVRHGIAVSFAAAFVQALSAIVIVAVAAMVFRVTARSMTVATEWVEIASYALITVVGAWLLWSKLFGGGDNHHHHHHHDDRNPQDPSVQGAGGSGGWKSGLAGAWSVILAVGIRPCSGDHAFPFPAFLPDFLHYR